MWSRDLAAAVAFFVELGLELEGEASVEGEWVDQLVGLDSVRADIAIVRTPDGHSRVELSAFHAPVATSTAPRAPVNTPGIPSLTSAVDDVLDRLRAHGAELGVSPYQFRRQLARAESRLLAFLSGSVPWPAG